MIDQFLQDGSNNRSDRYGGSLENRARLMLEVADAAIDVWGAGKVGMHIAPRCDAHQMGDTDPAKTFGYVAEQLGKRRLAFVFARELLQPPRLGPQLKTIFGGAWIANQELDAASGQALLNAGEADAIAFGKAFISNPDLVLRLQEKAALNPWDMNTFYSEGPVGYTDYPALETVAA